VVAVDGGPTRRAPAVLPSLGPGTEAVVPVPPELLADLPADGEVWLTLHVAGAGDEVATPGFRLRGDDRGLRARVGGTADEAELGINLDDEGLLVHPSLAVPPRLSLWRAPTDNDRAGAILDRWRELGLGSAPERRLVDVKSEGGRVFVRAEYVVGAAVVRHEQVLTRLRTPEGAVLLVEEAAVVPDALTDLPRVGTVLETVAGFDTLEWFGRGPYETYPDRCTAGWVGEHAIGVDAAFTPYIRPQESGGRHGVRRLRLSGDAGDLALHLDRPRQVSATRHRAEDLEAAAHHGELVPRPGVVVHLDAAHRGLGTASCGPDTLTPYLVGGGRYRWAWTLGSTAVDLGRIP
jgi:beta-galactosidase